MVGGGGGRFLGVGVRRLRITSETDGMRIGIFEQVTSEVRTVYRVVRMVEVSFLYRSDVGLGRYLAS